MRLTKQAKPKGYYIEVSDGDCYHRELWFGLPAELEERLREVSEMAKSWRWDCAVITATEWKKGDSK